jgi:hypothetical protein
MICSATNSKWQCADPIQNLQEIVQKEEAVISKPRILPNKI